MKTRSLRSNRSATTPQSHSLRVEHVPVRRLTPSPKNARLHPTKQIDKLAQAIGEFGFLIPVLVDARDEVIAGHARLEAAKRCGLAEVPCVRASHLTGVQKRAFAIFDNRLGEDADWDFQVLANELDFLQSEGIDLKATGFDVSEIESILAVTDSQTSGTEDDKVPELQPTRAVTQPNELWTLGEHRLICADARRRESFELLLSGRKANMAFLDPPYNLKIRGPISGKGRVKHGEFVQASGEMTPAQFQKFLDDALSAVADYSMNGSIHFVCIDWRHIEELLTAGRRVYNELKNLVVWNKTNSGLGSFYRSQHELILVWKHGRGKHSNNVQLGKHGRNRSNVWTYAGANGFNSDRLANLAIHPTAKPVGLVADAILDCSRRGDIVLDSFGGSGTTLIACERTNRRARLIEIDPVFCDQSVRRWQRLTGGTAVNAAGVRFNDLDKS